MLNLEDWLNREEEKRELEERTLPINEMDDIIPIYDTDGMPFEEDGVFNDVDGMTAPPSEATIRKSLTSLGWGERKSKYAGMPPLTVSEGTLKMALRYDILDYPKDDENEEDLEDSLEDVIDDEEFELELLTEQEKEWRVKNEGRSYGSHRKENFKKRKESIFDQKYHWGFKTQPISNHNFDIYAFKIVNLLKQFYEIISNKVNRKYFENKVKRNKKSLSSDLATYVLALETVGKQRWIKKYLPDEIYEAIMKQCEDSYNKSFNASLERYKIDHEGKELSITKERYLEMIYEDLKGRKIKLSGKYL